MKQLDLFDNSDVAVSQYGTPIDTKPLARRDDPETSKVAAESVDTSQCELIFLKTLKDIGTFASAYEVADVQNEWPVRDTIRKRAGALKFKELIVVVDRLGVTRDGRSCERFLVTQKGLKVIEG